MKADELRGHLDGLVLAVLEERSLHGPAHLKRRLLKDAADGLADTVAAYRATGIDEAQALARAIADFGNVPRVDPAFQEELDVAGARRLAAVNVLVLPLLTVFWNYVWEHNPTIPMGLQAG
jgi:hypothetical protein